MVAWLHHNSLRHITNDVARTRCSRFGALQQNKDDLFRCLCLPGFEGKFCEKQFNDCDSMVCHKIPKKLLAFEKKKKIIYEYMYFYNFSKMISV
jgi:hypothetical protein